MKLRRIGVVVGAAALALGLTSSPASAEMSYFPTEADFADCPPKPAGAEKWTCYVSTALEGGFTLGSKKNIRVLIDKPMRITSAEGTLADGTKVTAFGGVRQPQNFKVVTVVPGTKVILSVLPEIEGRFVGVGLNGNEPDEFKVRFQLWSPGGLLGSNCTIGTDADPIVFKPKINVSTPWLFWLTPMAKVWANEKNFALPASTGCSAYPLLGHPDQLLGLPSAGGTNSADFVWAVRHKTF
ncbi:hypothetical protein [Actinocorallia libanotica]|uniref:Secreted protein n=1 Tax=Actinocorallia libanotica TaxID=46162 RepID=A0ABN1QZK7_9ACTN